MKEYVCDQVKHHNKIAEKIEEYQKYVDEKAFTDLLIDYE